MGWAASDGVTAEVIEAGNRQAVMDQIAARGDNPDYWVFWMTRIERPMCNDRLLPPPGVTWRQRSDGPRREPILHMWA